MSNWIKTKDRLPVKDGYVICHKHNGLVVPLFFSTPCELKNVSCGFNYNGLDQTSQVVHWQPLPPPPESTHTPEEINSWDIAMDN